MENQMFVRFTNDIEKPVEWLLLDKNKNVIRDFTQALIDECDIIVIVPGSDVILMELNLPTLSANKLRKAIPYALEASLSDDIENLHFSLGHWVGNKGTVAVVSKKKMDAWLVRLNVFFKLQPYYLKMLLPDTLLVPWQPFQWVLAAENNRVLVRTNKQAGFAIEQDALLAVLYQSLKVDTYIPPREIVVIGELALPVSDLDYLKKIALSFQIKPKMNLLEELSSSFNQSNAINLLQGIYKIKPFFSRDNFYYWCSALLVMLCLFLLISGDVFKWAVLQYRLTQLEHKAFVITQKIFPDAVLNNVDDMSRLIEKRLKLLDNVSMDNDFLTIMDDVAPIISSLKNISLTGFTFANHTLSLSVQATSFSLLDDLVKLLKAQNYKVELHDAVKSADHIQAAVTIQEGRI